MDLNTLRVFARVGELKSFTKAALALGVTQPTVSRVVSELEGEFGGPLFYRTGRGVTLTELGDVAFPKARALLEHADQLSADMVAIGKSPAGLVSLGLQPTMMQPLAAALFEVLRERMPGIRLRIFEAFSGQIERWLADGQVDIGLLSRYRAIHKRTDEVLRSSPLLLVRAANSPKLPARVDFASIGGLPLVLPAIPNGLRGLLEDTARSKGIRLDVVLESDSLNAQKDVVRRCGCYTVLAPQAIYDEQAAGILAASEIARPSLLRQAVLTSSQHRPLSRAGREVLRAIRELVGRLVKQGAW